MSLFIDLCAQIFFSCMKIHQFFSFFPVQRSGSLPLDSKSFSLVSFKPHFILRNVEYLRFADFISDTYQIPDRKTNVCCTINLIIYDWKTRSECQVFGDINRGRQISIFELTSFLNNLVRHLHWCCYGK